jgi:glycosyltransferase involved in cell wall biosynthesis
MAIAAIQALVEDGCHERLQPGCSLARWHDDGNTWAYHDGGILGRITALYSRSVAGLTASVVLCVRDGEATIAAQLSALASQDYQDPWELVVVDNGSSDRTVEIVESFRPTLGRLRLVAAPMKASLGYARNEGARAAEAEILAFCDADDVVREGWLRSLVAAIEFADLVGGRLCFGRLNPADAIYWKGDNPTTGGLPVGHGYLAHVVGANFAVRRAAFFAVDGCDDVFTSSSDDVDLSWRMHRAGYRLAFAPDAVVDYRLRGSLKDAARQQLGYGRSELLLYCKHRSEGMRRNSIREVGPVYRYLLTRWDHLLRGRRLRGRWVVTAAYRAGRLSASVRARTWFP